MFISNDLIGDFKLNKHTFSEKRFLHLIGKQFWVSDILRESFGHILGSIDRIVLEKFK
jgi:hypothetical protein